MKSRVRLAVHRPRTRSELVETAFTLSVAASGPHRSICGAGRRDGPRRALPSMAERSASSFRTSHAPMHSRIEALRFRRWASLCRRNYPQLVFAAARQGRIPALEQATMIMATLETTTRSAMPAIAPFPASMFSPWK